MRTSLARLAAVAIAALSLVAASSGKEQGGYRIQNADRGLVHRVKVLYDEQTIATIVLSRTRKQSSSYCCTPTGCTEIALAASCSTFKMTCDTSFVCTKN